MEVFDFLQGNYCGRVRKRSHSVSSEGRGVKTLTLVISSVFQVPEFSGRSRRRDPQVTCRL